VDSLDDPTESGHEPGRRGADDQDGHAVSLAPEPDG